VIPVSAFIEGVLAARSLVETVGIRTGDCSEILIPTYKEVSMNISIIGIDKSNSEEMSRAFYHAD